MFLFLGQSVYDGYYKREENMTRTQFQEYWVGVEGRGTIETTSLVFCVYGSMIATESDVIQNLKGTIFIIIIIISLKKIREFSGSRYYEKESTAESEIPQTNKIVRIFTLTCSALFFISFKSGPSVLINDVETIEALYTPIQCGP